MLPKIFTIDLRAPNPCPAYIPPTLIKQGKYCCIPSFSALLPKKVSGTGGRHLTNPHSCPWLYFSFRDAIIQVKIFTKIVQFLYYFFKRSAVMKNFVIPTMDTPKADTLSEYLNSSIEAFSNITGISVTYFNDSDKIVKEFKKRR